MAVIVIERKSTIIQHFFKTDVLVHNKFSARTAGFIITSFVYGIFLFQSNPEFLGVIQETF